MSKENQFVQRLIERGHLAVFSGNMFDVAIFGRDQDTKNETLEFPRSHLYCSAVSVGSPELKYKNRHPLTREQLLEGIQLQDTVTITWLEDRHLQVWNYHRNWLSYFYDPVRDQFRSGVYGKKRSAEIYLQELKSPETPFAINARENAEAESIQHFLVFEGLMPLKLPELSLGWDTDNSNFTQIQIQYRFDTLKYEVVRDELTQEEESRIGRPFRAVASPDDSRVSPTQEAVEV